MQSQAFIWKCWSHFKIIAIWPHWIERGNGEKRVLNFGCLLTLWQLVGQEMPGNAHNSQFVSLVISISGKFLENSLMRYFCFYGYWPGNATTRTQLAIWRFIALSCSRMEPFCRARHFHFLVDFWFPWRNLVPFKTIYTVKCCLHTLHSSGVYSYCQK